MCNRPNSTSFWKDPASNQQDLPQAHEKRQWLLGLSTQPQKNNVFFDTHQAYFEGAIRVSCALAVRNSDRPDKIGLMRFWPQSTSSFSWWRGDTLSWRSHPGILNVTFLGIISWISGQPRKCGGGGGAGWQLVSIWFGSLCPCIWVGVSCTLRFHGVQIIVPTHCMLCWEQYLVRENNIPRNHSVRLPTVESRPTMVNRLLTGNNRSVTRPSSPPEPLRKCLSVPDQSSHY